MEINGERVLHAGGGNFDREQLMQQFANCRYIHTLKMLCKQFDLDLIFDENFQYDPQAHSVAEMYNNVLQGTVTATTFRNLNLIYVVSEEKENVMQMLEGHDIRPIQLSSGFNLNASGQSTQLPEIVFNYSKVRLILPENIDTLDVGDEFEVVCEPAADCVVTMFLGQADGSGLKE